MGWLADKMRKWRESTDRHGGTGKGARVVEGWEALTDDLGAIARWSEGAQRRLSEEVPDAEARRLIMLERSCVFTEEFGDEDILQMRVLYRETGSLDTVLAAMRDNAGRFGEPFIEEGAIIEIRRPRDPEALAAACSDAERLAAACYCPLARESRNGLPLEYCCCSSGWYKGIYEGIFGAPADVSVEESLLNGDDRCRFVIRIRGVTGA
jgi:hypothetical protein